MNYNRADYRKRITWRRRRSRPYPSAWPLSPISRVILSFFYRFDLFWFTSGRKYIRYVHHESGAVRLRATMWKRRHREIKRMTNYANVKYLQRWICVCTVWIWLPIIVVPRDDIRQLQIFSSLLLRFPLFEPVVHLCPRSLSMYIDGWNHSPITVEDEAQAVRGLSRENIGRRHCRT